jgi:hypothetical protein
MVPGQALFDDTECFATVRHHDGTTAFGAPSAPRRGHQGSWLRPHRGSCKHLPLYLGFFEFVLNDRCAARNPRSR